MKKRSFKKYIPKGRFCLGCPYKRLIKSRANKSNCNLSSICKNKCWSSDTTKCIKEIYACKYIGMQDGERRTGLWDGFKICEEKIK
ncbi:hypothetical protein BJV85_002771 [Clostridium acetobutylicum]|uniref:Uncharacterized protein n=1 Tax=Clostridium acetobutylicum (strain ATCC 824 / DSM 792 / JCM 1419 / IAM 19013 / LMG 5710 / NBRC 13948 / NRRL B-527 / VKM B-1787 / 2291 / W) TaxID=272562 RepID=Q97JP8_CLOAB|nr:MULTISPECIES: hypothetical protein [Clostridium]AAK79197.1 Hypothetical protein CA_C1225 [Clostridium acetobutylicum ATCC 824]ADZ20276.1 Conserved hypothetical protein [Clostridium acetobutylicum EA 2018]AEI31726.1 hypothetical protein SMB_G1246 [Clostridium acetobutylicum DSM 1731]AWV81552.1 hypothetical protein DK921_15925 [Clostridium acetobutylicum]MBC2393192.1 hypothetical protein [Clostridium acetobutylicum]